MSEENIELVRQAEETILRRDRDAWFAIHDEDFDNRAHPRLARGWRARSRG